MHKTELLTCLVVTDRAPSPHSERTSGVLCTSRFASEIRVMELPCQINGQNLKDVWLLEQIRWKLMRKNWTSPLLPLVLPLPDLWED